MFVSKIKFMKDYIIFCVNIFLGRIDGCHDIKGSEVIVYTVILII